MILYSYPTFFEGEVIVSGTMRTSIEQFWRFAHASYPLDDDFEHYLVTSKNKHCQLLFSGYREGDIMQIIRLVPLGDCSRFVWRRLVSLLDVKHVEVSVDPSSMVEKRIADDLGLTLCGKRIEFDPYDISTFCPRAPMIREQENCSLEEIEAVCAIAKKTHLGYKALLREVANAFTQVLVRVQNEEVTAAAFIRSVGNVDTLTTYLSIREQNDIRYGQDFSEFFRYMLNRCGEQKRKFRISLAPKATVPEYDGIRHEVITYCYTLP